MLKGMDAVGDLIELDFQRACTAWDRANAGLMYFVAITFFVMHTTLCP